MPQFEEKQTLAPWVALLFFGLFALIIATVAAQQGFERAGETALWLSPAFVLLMVFLQGARMKTRVDESGVRVTMFYFVDRRIAFSQIVSAQMTTYRPLRDYGGWGYRIGPAGKAYNMRGDEGVQLILGDGGRVLIGSQRPGELAEAIKAGMARAPAPAQP